MDTDCAVDEDINMDVLNSNTDDNDANDNDNDVTNTTTVAVLNNGDNKRIKQHMESIFAAIRSHLSAACLLELLEIEDSIACSSDWVNYRSDAPGRRTLGRW